MDDRDLDDVFATARHQTPQVPVDLMARVLGDAEMAQPRAARHFAAFATPPKPGFWAGLLAAIGGAPALAGLSTAALAGLWIGFAQPVAVTSVADVLLADNVAVEPLDIMPAYDDFLTEG